MKLNLYPTDTPKCGPVINPRYKAYATDKIDNIRAELRLQGANFLADCGINKQEMLTDIPEHYRGLAATHPASPIGANEAHVHNTMYEAYRQFRNIQAGSIWAVQDQGVIEINISLLGHHINQKLAKLHKVGGETEQGLDAIAKQVRDIEQEASNHGSLQIIAGAIEILQKYRRVANRLELIKRRSTPSIRCSPAPKFDLEGNGGTPPEMAITYAGHMPYCGPTFGLSHMHIITEHGTKKDDDDDAKSEQSAKSTPRRCSKGLKREAPGTDTKTIDPKAPEPNGVGIFKAGTNVHRGIFRCPTDMQVDTPQGHTQSDVLDLITETIARLKQMESTITGGHPSDDFVIPNENDTAETKEKLKGEVAATTNKEESAAKKSKGGASAAPKS